MTAFSPQERRRTLAGLNPFARKLAAALLAEFSGWHAASLVTLRAYALSAERLERLQQAGASRELYAEIRANVALHRLLNLEATPE